MQTEVTPPGFRKVSWDDVENGQSIWYQTANPLPLGPWVVVDRQSRLVRPFSGTVQRRLTSDEVLVKDSAKSF